MTLRELVSELDKVSLDYSVPIGYEMKNRQKVISRMLEIAVGSKGKYTKKAEMMGLMQKLRGSPIFYPVEMTDIMDEIDEKLEEWNE